MFLPPFNLFLIETLPADSSIFILRTVRSRWISFPRWTWVPWKGTTATTAASAAYFQGCSTAASVTAPTSASWCCAITRQTASWWTARRTTWSWTASSAVWALDAPRSRARSAAIVIAPISRPPTWTCSSCRTTTSSRRNASAASP